MSKLIATLAETGKTARDVDSQIRGVKATFTSLRSQLSAKRSEIDSLGKADVDLKNDSVAELDILISDLDNILASTAFVRY